MELQIGQKLRNLIIFEQVDWFKVKMDSKRNEKEEHNQSEDDRGPNGLLGRDLPQNQQKQRQQIHQIANDSFGFGAANTKDLHESDLGNSNNKADEVDDTEPAKVDQDSQDQLEEDYGSQGVNEDAEQAEEEYDEEEEEAEDELLQNSQEADQNEENGSQTEPKGTQDSNFPEDQVGDFLQNEVLDSPPPKNIFGQGQESSNNDIGSNISSPQLGGHPEVVVESGRITADLIQRSEMAKARKQEQEIGKSLELKKQNHSANANILSYQTANFGAQAMQAQAKEDHPVEKGVTESIDNQNLMFASMSDIGFVAAAHASSHKKLDNEASPVVENSDEEDAKDDNIISEAQKEKMMDASNNWKVRTQTIDEIHVDIQEAIDKNPEVIVEQSEALLNFFISLLGDQNFKIVLMTLSIVNLILATSRPKKSDSINSCLTMYIPKLINKLSDSKNIIRQQAIRALIGIFQIMRAEDSSTQTIERSPTQRKTGSSKFVPLVLPYLTNSSSWHIREELLNVLIICFLMSKNFYEFDSYIVMEALLKMLDDSKERIRFTALEAIVALSSIGNKFSAKEIVYQLADSQITDLVTERLEASPDMNPYLNENGALEIPYLEHIEMAANQMSMAATAKSLARENLNSGPAGQIKQLVQNNTAYYRRGNSSGNKFSTGGMGNTNQAPPSANSISNAAIHANQSKRTASAHLLKQLDMQNQQNSQLLTNSNLRNNNNLAPIPGASQSPLFNMYGQSQSEYNHGSSIRQNQRISADLLTKPGSGFLPPLQKQSSNKLSTPSHHANQNFYGSQGVNQSPGGLHGMVQRGPPSSENRVHAHQSDPGSSSFYYNTGMNYQRQVSANSMGGPPLSGSQWNMGSQQQTTMATSNMQFHQQANNPLANHPIHQLKRGNITSANSGLGSRGTQGGSSFEDQLSEVGYLGIKHPPVEGTYQDAASNYYMRAVHAVQNMQQPPPQRDSGHAGNFDLQSQSSNFSRQNIQSTGSNMPQVNLDGNKMFTPARQMPGGTQAKKTSYSDGSFMTNTTTASTQIANRLQRGQIDPKSLELVASSHSANVVPPAQEEQKLIIGRNYRGPVKAIRQASLKQQESSKTVQIQPQQTTQQAPPAKQSTEQPKQVPQPPGERRPRRPMGASSYQIESYEDAFENGITGLSLQQQKRQINQSEQRGQAAETMGTTQQERNPQMEFDVTMNKVYLTQGELKPISSASRTFKKAMNDLIQSSDWNVQFDACDILRRVFKHHQDLVLQHGATLHSLVKQLIKLADSLRSSLAKQAMITINDMFVFLKRCMEAYLDPIIKILLKRSANTENAFICEAAEKALITMTYNCNDTKVLYSVLSQQVNSRNNQMRLNICRCLESLTASLGNNILFFKDSDRLVCQLANYMSDACQEVRNTAKQGFLTMSRAIMGQNDLERLLNRVLNESQYKRVKGYLDQEPQYFDHSQRDQNADFLITNAGLNRSNSGLGSRKNLRVPKGTGGTLRTGKNVMGSSASGSFNMTGMSGANDTPDQLNIQATSIVNPKAKNKIPRPPPNLKTKQGSVQSQYSEHSNNDTVGGVDQRFAEQVREAVKMSQSSDWRSRHESADFIFGLIEQNMARFQGNKSSLTNELADVVCKLISDSNTKIQLHSFDRFSNLLRKVMPFVETYMAVFFNHVQSQLISTNASVRRQADSLITTLYESANKTLLIQPLCQAISYSNNVRLKPTLIEHLTDYFCDSAPPGQITKLILPLAYKLLDDNRTDVRSKTDRLLKRLHQISGQQVIDQCPNAKLQRVSDIVTTSGSSSSGFGVVTNNLILQTNNNR